MKFSMTGQEKDDILIQVTAWTVTYKQLKNNMGNMKYLRLIMFYWVVVQKQFYWLRKPDYPFHMYIYMYDSPDFHPTCAISAYHP